MKTILIVALLIIFAIICIQDFKYRTIHAFLLVGIATISLGINYLEPLLNLYDMLQSIVFLGITSIGFMIYQTLKHKHISNPIDTAIGLGDILFFIAITPLFQVHNYVLFFVLGLLLSVVIYVLTSKSETQTTIPLAGYLALFLMVCFGLKLCNLVNPFFIEFN